MDPKTVWAQFREKVAQGSLSNDDFYLHANINYTQILSSPIWASLRTRIASQLDPVIEHGEDKLIFTIKLNTTDHLRMDFLVRGDRWQFYLLDGLTIPIRSIPQLPFTDFPPIPETEDWMRMERVVSDKVHLYCRLKSLLGGTKALEWFHDGYGYRLNSESWVPFFTSRKSFVVASAWMERRYWGQHMEIIDLSEEKAALLFRNHLYFSIYERAGHLKPQLSLEEYRELFEDQWKDRCTCAGWSVQFQYQNNDTKLILAAIPMPPVKLSDEK